VGRFAKSTEIIFIRDNHPAIIDEATFETAQQRMQDRRSPVLRTPVRNNDQFILTGMLRCGACGTRMHGDRCKGPIRYFCGRHRGQGDCLRNTVWQDEVLRYTIPAIVDYFTGPETEARLREELRRQMMPKEEPTQDAVQAQADKCQAEI